MNKFPSCCSEEQTKQINEILNLKKNWYDLSDLFTFLPGKIEYNNAIGYLRLSKFDIAYSALETERNNSVVVLFQFMMNNENVYDGFIQAIRFFKEHEDKIKFLEK